MTDTIHYANFSARWLRPLKPLVDHAREIDPLRFIDGSICLEPCHQGGAFIVAVTGHCTVIIHDKDAHATSAVTLDIPNEAFEIAKGPKPVKMTFEGEPYECPLPEWAQPDKVHVSSAGIFITTKMRNPDWAEQDDHFHPALYSHIARVGGVHMIGSDYSLKPSVHYDWRKVLNRALTEMDSAGTGEVCFNPEVPNLLTGLIDLLRVDKALGISHRASGNGWGPFITRISGHPEIVALWMPMNRLPVEDVPAYFLTPATTHAGSRAKQ